jgi:hypothetical protein
VVELSLAVDGDVFDLFPVGVVDLDVESMVIGFTDVLRERKFTGSKRQRMKTMRNDSLLKR